MAFTVTDATRVEAAIAAADAEVAAAAARLKAAENAAVGAAADAFLNDGETTRRALVEAEASVRAAQADLERARTTAARCRGIEREATRQRYAQSLPDLRESWQAASRRRQRAAAFLDSAVAGLAAALLLYLAERRAEEAAAAHLASVGRHAGDGFTTSFTREPDRPFGGHEPRPEILGRALNWVHGLMSLSTKARQQALAALALDHWQPTHSVAADFGSTVAAELSRLEAALSKGPK